MKIGLLSDTHGRTDLVKSVNVIFRNRGLSALIHAGDVTRLSHIQPLLHLGLTMHLVFGNCDYNPNPFRQAVGSTPLEIHGSSQVLDFDDRTIGITHGHHEPLFDQLIEAEPDFIIHGHTHERRDERDGEVRFINPGSVKPPGSSVAILDLEQEQVDFIDLGETNSEPSGRTGNVSN
jgi:putative phosphoesterase